jgi:hypothetical protein
VYLHPAILSRSGAIPEPPVVSGRRPSWTILATIAGFAVVTIYCTYLSVYMIVVQRSYDVARESVQEYHRALGGTVEFPYQWRLLGTYLVRAGERLTGADPNAVAVVLEALLLFVSSTTLFVYSRRQASEVGSLCVVACYQLAVAIGFSDPFRIYFINDYVMIACWFAAAYFVADGRYLPAALLTFAGAWAKETMLLVPLLVVLRRLHGHARNRDVALALAAFLVPTVILRMLYPAPLGKWAWWTAIFFNVPLFQLSWRMFAFAVKSSLMAAVVYNALWIVAVRALLKAAKGGFVRDLASTGAAYLALIFPVVLIREVRHFLPLAIVVLPAAIGELERRAAAAAIETADARPR